MLSLVHQTGPLIPASNPALGFRQLLRVYSCLGGVFLSGLTALADRPLGAPPALEASCLKCHNVDKHKGGVDLSSQASVSRKVWSRALEQVVSGEMPPDGQKPMEPEAKQQLLRWLKDSAQWVDCSRGLQAGPNVLRRLNKAEYANTLRDLTGLSLDAAEAVGMPDEGVVTGFSNLGAALNLPPTLMEKYFAAADLVLDSLFLSLLPPAKKNPDAKQLKESEIAANKVCFVRPSPEMDAAGAARQVLGQFAERAYRRPVGADETRRLLAVFENATARGLGFDLAIRAALKPVLVSPHFLYRMETPVPSSEGAVRISDHELATRLSYFLWSSMPDEQLSSAANAGSLHETAGLEGQIRRMLESDRAVALAQQFASQWLQIGKVDKARPSTEFFPTFNNEVRAGMREEALRFVDALRREDRSVLELLDADYTFLNATLAKHYGVKGVDGGEFRRVSLAPEDHRGGVLGMGAVLAATSHTHRTSPTLRGKYILEVIFGTPPAPPPPNAGMLKGEKDKADPKTFREQMAQHAADPDCAGCHRKMDPLGFALENYDAVGVWRESTAERPLDNSGKLPTGESFQGAAELKKLILSRKDQFLHHLVEQMFVYALGRELVDSDECAVREVLAKMRLENYRFSSLVVGVAQSVPFQYRSPEEPDQNVTNSKKQ